MVGAALATTLTEAVRTVVVVGYSGAAGLPFTSSRRFWRAGVAGGAMTIVLLVTRAAPWWGAVALGALAYGAVLTMLGGLRFRRGARPELAV